MILKSIVALSVVCLVLDTTSTYITRCLRSRALSKEPMTSVRFGRFSWRFRDVGRDLRGRGGSSQR
jgi:hypothetical protein